MKKLFALALTVASLVNLAFPATSWAMAGTENYIIDQCDYEDGTSNWELLLTDGVTHGIGTVDAEHGKSYVVSVPAGKSPAYSYEQKQDTFEHGEITMEMDFRYSRTDAVIYFFANRNDVDTGTISFNPNVLQNGKIGNKEISVNEWHHIKYVMNIEKKYYRTYIDDISEPVLSGDNQTPMLSNRYIRTTLITDDCADTLNFAFDNITIKQTQDNISRTRATVSSVEFFTASEVTYGEGVTEINDDVFYANITMSKGVSGIALRNRAVKATVDGKPVDVYAYGSKIGNGYAYQYTWDHDYPTTFTVYFSEKPKKGSKIQIDLRNLNDNADYRVNENCIIDATIEGDTPTDVKWSLEKEDGTKVYTTSQLENGDKVCAKAAITAGADVVGKGAILAVASYNGDKMTDMIATDVTIPNGQQTLTSDYLTVSDMENYKIKEFLIFKENVAPVVDVNAITDVYEQESTSDVKADMKINLPATAKAIINRETYENGDRSIMAEYPPYNNQLAIVADPLDSSNSVKGYVDGTLDTLYIHNNTGTFAGIGTLCMEMDIMTNNTSAKTYFQMRTSNNGEKTTNFYVSDLGIQANKWYRVKYAVNAVDSTEKMYLSSDNGNSWSEVYSGATDVTLGGVFASTRVYVNATNKSNYRFYMDDVEIYYEKPAMDFEVYNDSGYQFGDYELFDEENSPHGMATMLQLNYPRAKSYFKDTICLVVDSNFFWGLDEKYKVTDKVLWVDEDIYVSVDMMNKIFGEKTYTLTRKLNGKDYVSLKFAAKDVLNLNVSVTDHGMAVISNRKFNIENEISRVLVDLMMRYIITDKPTPKMLEEGVKDLEHPYLLPVDRLATIKSKIEAGDEALRNLSDGIIRQANNPTYLMLNYEEMTKAGEPYSGMTPDDVFCYYWAYYMTGDEAYANKTIEDAMEMALWTSYNADSNYLHTARVITALAYTLDLFYDKLTIVQKDAIREAIVTKGLVPTYKYWYQSDYGWARRSTNWNTFCNAGVIIGALAVRGDYAADTVTPFYYLAHAISSLEFQSLAYGPNGGWKEGLHYSTMTVNKYVEALAALESVYGTDFSLSAVPGFMNYGNFPMYMGTNNGVIALGDSGVQKVADSSASSYIAYKTNNIAMQRRRLQQIIISGMKYNFQDLLWHIDDSGKNSIVDMPLDMNYSFTEIATARDNWGESATFMAAHAGATNDPHGHYDAGSFMYQSGGRVFADDTGMGNYGISGFHTTGDNAERNKFYNVRAEAHNVYVINPDETPGQQFNAETEVQTVELKPNGAIYTIDLTPAYIGKVRKALRGFMLTAGRKVFVVQDEIKPKSKSDNYHWFWHTQANVRIVSDDTVRLTREGKSVDLYFDSNVPFTLTSGVGEPLSTSPTVEGQLAGRTNRITAQFTSSADEIIFRVTAVPVGMNYTRGSLRHISSWTIADGIRSDEYTIANGTVSNVKYGTSVEEFLSNIFVSDSKKVTKDGERVTSGTVKHGMKLVADGITYDIGFIGSGATVAEYNEETSVGELAEERTAFDGFEVTADGGTYTIRTSSSYMLNAISNVYDETPTALMLKDLEPVIGKATADGDVVYDGMKVTASSGRIYTVDTIDPVVMLDFENSNDVLDFSATTSYNGSDIGFDRIYVDAVGGATVKSEACEGRTGKALHFTTDGTATKQYVIQFQENVDVIRNAAYEFEFWFKSDTEDISFFTGIDLQTDVRFQKGGRVTAYSTPGYTVDSWVPGKWYNVKLKINPVESWEFILEVNGREVAYGHHEDLCNAMTYFKPRVFVDAGVKASVWIDDIKLTRIYG